MGYTSSMKKRKGLQGQVTPPRWILSDLLLPEISAGLIAIGTVSPFTPQGALGYLNHTLALILDRLGKGITGSKGERVLISTMGRWKTPWVLLYGLGEVEGLSKEYLADELKVLARDLEKLKVSPPAFLLPGYDPYRWGTPQEAARLLIDNISPPAILLNPQRDILHRIHYHCRGPFSYLLRSEVEGR